MGLYHLIGFFKERYLGFLRELVEVTVDSLYLLEWDFRKLYIYISSSISKIAFMIIIILVSIMSLFKILQVYVRTISYLYLTCLGFRGLNLYDFLYNLLSVQI